LLTGLAHVGIAACCYPREDDLESDIAVRRSVLAVDALVTETCKRFADQAPDPDAASGPDAMNVWQLWLETPETRSTRGDRYAADCRLGIIQNAFGWLEDQGFAKKMRPEGTYQVNDRYRIQIRDLAGSDTLDRLREVAASDRSADTGRSEGDRP
jgi:hypothetical protein